MKGLSERGQTIIVVTHDMAVAEQTDSIMTIAMGGSRAIQEVQDER